MYKTTAATLAGLVLAAGLTGCGSSGDARCQALGSAIADAGQAASEFTAGKAPSVLADQFAKVVDDVKGEPSLDKVHAAAQQVVADLRGGQREPVADLAAFNAAAKDADATCS